MTRTTAGLLISVFIHAMTFFATTYYNPLYFQILGSSATRSGVQLMPLALSSSIMAVASGIVLSKTGKYKPILIFSFVLMMIGYGVMIILDEKSSKAAQAITILIAGIGIGCFFQPPLIALQAAMPLKDMATSTSTYRLIRTLGGTIGISIGGTVYASELSRRLRKIPNLQAPSDPVTGNIASLRKLPEPIRTEVLHAYTRSISTIWIVAVPMSFVGLLCVLCVRSYSLQQAHVQGANKDAGDAEGVEADVPVPETAANADTEKQPIPQESAASPKARL